MMNVELDWAAPIIPGYSMMGLQLGMSYADVLELLKLYKVVENDNMDNLVVRFKNSPLLQVELVADGIILHDATSNQNNNSNFDTLFTMGFKDGVLVHLMTSLIYGASLDYYKGHIWGEIGFGSLIANVSKHCEIEFDAGDELFYPVDEKNGGLSIGGACNALEEDPDQLVSYMRIYVPV